MNRIAKLVGLAGWERKRDEGSRNGCAATAGLSKRSTRSDKGFRTSDCAHVFRAPEDDGGADSLREMEESAYWLELLVESGVVSVEKLAPLRQECEELTAIFVTILKRAKTS